MCTDVTCYAGASYPERPRAFTYREMRLQVTEVERRERTPRGTRFRVRVADGQRFWLSYDHGRDAWNVRPLRRPPDQGDGL
ncbi:MAG: hypothetical protein KGY78_01065 [Anaerolineae bacterium]|nr:hypothetical protein [Anaerolineae bacterium]